jgi:hypothetical protein
MTSQDFDTLRNESYSRAIAARNFAAKLDDQNELKAARVWHALADRLFEATEQADNMREVLIVR